MVRTELHGDMPLQGPKCYIPHKSTSCLFVAYCHEFRNKESWIRQSIFLLTERELKNLLFNLLITERGFENFSSLSSCSFSQRWRFRRLRSNVSQVTESDIACTKVSGFFPSALYGLEAYG